MPPKRKNKASKEHKPDEQDEQQKGKKQKLEEKPKETEQKQDEQQKTFQGDLYNIVPSHDHLCYACGKHIKGSVYHCEAKERYLHPFCLRLNPMIIDRRQSYTLVESSPIICKCCNIKDDNGGLSYVSTTKKDLKFHVYCFMKLIRDKNRDVKVKGLKTEGVLETMLSLTDIALDNLTGIHSMFSFMIVPQ